MGKCQSQESARDFAIPDELAVAEEPAAAAAAEVSTAVEEAAVETEELSVAAEKRCVTKQSLSEMPENVMDLDEIEQINIFSKLLVKNLIAQECAVAQQEEDEETEIKLQAMSVLKQVIQEGCKKMDGVEGEQTNAASNAEEAVVEAEAQASNDVQIPTDEKVKGDEVKLSSEEVPINDDENVTEAKASAAPGPKVRTNMFGGARGFSFMKRLRSSVTTRQAAKAGA